MGWRRQFAGRPRVGEESGDIGERHTRIACQGPADEGQTHGTVGVPMAAGGSGQRRLGDVLGRAPAADLIQLRQAGEKGQDATDAVQQQHRHGAGARGELGGDAACHGEDRGAAGRCDRAAEALGVRVHACHDLFFSFEAGGLTNSMLECGD
jgi:hypothetical protein